MSWLLATAIVAAALILAVRQNLERQSRDDDLSEDDDRHYRRQDLRRFLGAGVMALVAVAIAVGSHINPFLSIFNRRMFGSVWVAVILLVFVLLALAWLDWLATLSYARRHRKAIADERKAIIDAERRRRAFPTNGRSGPPGFSNPPPS